MSAFELLTTKDKELISQYISEFGPAPNHRSLETVLRAWNKEKSTLVELFDGNLILEKPLNYTMPDEARHQMFDRILLTETPYSYNRILSFIRDHITNDDYSHIGDILSSESLAYNGYRGNNGIIGFHDIPCRNYNIADFNIKVNYGMKPMKIIHKLLEHYCPKENNIWESYEDLRLWHSMRLNQVAFHGNLALSIHPLDYMTMSDNTITWSSCMHWVSRNGDYGDYRAGTLECMNSPYIVVAYLHNPSKPMQLTVDGESWSWNNKKWRELFIINEGMITEIKGYPFQDKYLTNEVLNWLKSLAADNLGWEYGDDVINVKDEFQDDGHCYAFSFAPTYHMYNDFGTLEQHNGYINIEMLRNLGDRRRDGFYMTEYKRYNSSDNNIIIDIPYGGYATCVCCGNELDEDESYSSLAVCSDCDDCEKCPCCGERIHGESFFVSAYSDPICYGCYTDETTTDELNEEYELADSTITFSILLGVDKNGKKIWSPNTITTLNPNDYYNGEFNNIFKSGVKMQWDPKSWRYYYTIEDVQHPEDFIDAEYCGDADEMRELMASAVSI